MTHISVDVPPLAHVDALSGPELVSPKSLNRDALRAGTAIASAIRGALSLAPVSAFVAPPIAGGPEPAGVAPENLHWLSDRIRRILQPNRPAGGPPEQGSTRPPRLMPTDAGRQVNAMPSHAMAAGGRPFMMKLPGK